MSACAFTTIRFTGDVGVRLALATRTPLLDVGAALLFPYVARKNAPARLPDFGGIDAMIAIKAEFPNARIIMLTTFEGDVEVQRALEAGANGYLLKNIPSSELLHAVRQVHAGKKQIPQELAAQLVEHMGDQNLSAREMEVLKRVAQGNRNRDIGELLSISEATVKVHMKHIMEKLGAKDRTDAIAIAVRRGIIHI